MYQKENRETPIPNINSYIGVQSKCFIIVSSIEFLNHGREFSFVVQAQLVGRWQISGPNHVVELFRIYTYKRYKKNINAKT